MKKTSIKWFVVYKEIASKLYNFYLVNPEPGKALFNILFTSEEFLSANQWIMKYNTSANTRSVDPIQIFASFNGNKQTKENRSNRIYIILKHLSIGEPYQVYNDIDFYGCPSPVTINMISSRVIKEQDEIWQSFASVHKNHQKGLSEIIFSNSSRWYGIDSLSFTQFLFWIDSKNFLPLDKNTIAFLLSNKKINKRPASYQEYIDLITLKDTDIYRELTAISYDFIVKNIDSVELSDNLQEYLNNIVSLTKIDFKILAIKPLNGMDADLQKVLSSNTLYRFYNNYDFSNDCNTITYRKTVNPYLIEDFPSINISAIVGKNGTGKSTITELLYISIYNLALQKKLLNSSLNPILGLKLELYFTSDFLYRLTFRKGNIKVERYETNENIFQYPLEIDIKKLQLESFFYTIAINYSHYGLNAKKYSYDWITPLSHKNDGYQTPIVINPMRTDGNFDINKEDELLRSRLLSNILEPIDEDDTNTLRDIAENKRVTDLHLSVVEIKSTLSKTASKISRKDIENILEEVYNNFDINANVDVPFKDSAENYIVNKLISICKKYPLYKHYSILDNNNELLKELLINIQKDNSHVTYKIKQAIHYIKFNHLSEFIHAGKSEIKIKVEALSQTINNIKAQEESRKLSTIELIPPSFFNCEIILNNSVNIRKLSSGENQLINVLSSIAYHINNIASITNDSTIESYGYINIILDEVELYFHPDLQRKFIKQLYLYLTKLNVERIVSINLCFITHSPFILSDVINENILFLGDFPDDDMRSFGANLYDLLSNSFFLSDGFIGDFAQEKVQQIIYYLNDKEGLLPHWLKNNSDVRTFVDKIGEPFLREKLIEMYFNKYPGALVKEEKVKEIQRLKSLIIKLENDIN